MADDDIIVWLFIIVCCWLCVIVWWMLVCWCVFVVTFCYRIHWFIIWWWYMLIFILILSFSVFYLLIDGIHYNQFIDVFDPLSDIRVIRWRNDDNCYCVIVIYSMCYYCVNIIIIHWLMSKWYIIGSIVYYSDDYI